MHNKRARYRGDALEMNIAAPDYIKEAVQFEAHNKKGRSITAPAFQFLRYWLVFLAMRFSPAEGFELLKIDLRQKWQPLVMHSPYRGPVLLH